MFVNAIEIAAAFTRPIHIVIRTYGSRTAYPGAASLFFVNPDGWALTCKHVALHLVASEQGMAKYAAFVAELAVAKGKTNEIGLRKKLEKKYSYDAKTTVQVLNRFTNCVDTMTGVDIKVHGVADLALLKFKGFTKLHVSSFPTFARNGLDLKQGKFLCRLGFPFPEFTNYSYDSGTDVLAWETTGRDMTPQFPIEGMVTRHLGSPAGEVLGFEMSTPGLKGQSGGPAFDADGRVWGMQYGTNHLDLDFDIDQAVVRQGVERRVTDSAFLHVGHCVHVDVIKQFMRQHSVSFDEG